MKIGKSKNLEFCAALELLEKAALEGLSRTFLLLGPDSLAKMEWVRAFTARNGGTLTEIPCGTAADSLIERLALAQKTDGVLLLKDVEALESGTQKLLLHLLDRESLICFALTGQELSECVKNGTFSSELYAMLGGWTFAFPPLSARPEDLADTLELELERWSAGTGRQVSLEENALQKFLKFAGSMEAVWSSGLRDLRASVSRMSAMAVLKSGNRPGGVRISSEIVQEEIVRLRGLWAGEPPVIREARGETAAETARKILGEERWEGLDRFAKAQLADVLFVCRQAQSLSEAGRVLFSSSRLEKRTANDTDRLRKYLLKFGITWNEILNLPNE